MRRVAQLPPELLHVDAILSYLACPKKNHRHVPAIAFSQNRILVNVYFAKRSVELAKQRRNRGLGFLAQMASRSRVKRHFARTRGSQARVFGMRSGFEAHGFGFEYF